MINHCRLLVEFQPVNPARPVQFVVMDGPIVIAFLSYETVKQALEDFDRLKAAREGVDP